MLLLLDGGLDFVRTMVGLWEGNEGCLDYFFNHGEPCRVVKHVKVWESISKPLLKLGVCMGWVCSHKHWMHLKFSAV